jgi:DNA-binding transcriptional regulator GbsR (MarR family)
LSKSAITDAQRELIERIGVLHDRFGLPPAAGRVLGLLLVCEQPELTFDEIRFELSLSKSSTSAAVNLLLQVGTIEYTTRPGERKRYFRKKFDDWERSLLDRMSVLFSLRGLLAEALELREGAPEESNRAIARMVEFLGYLEGEIEDAYRRWENVSPTPKSE